MNILINTFYLGLMFFSGAAALVYQVIWQRVLSQEIGIDSSAVAIIVTVFMMGLGFGALYGGRCARKYSHFLPLIYGAIEAGIAGYGWVSNHILRSGNQWIATIFAPTLFLDFLVNLFLLFIPVFLMGMSTPIIMDMLKRSLSHLGRLVGMFYGINIFGAAVGALACGLYMIEKFGLNESVHYAAKINGVIALVALLITPIWYKTRRQQPIVESFHDAIPVIAKRHIYATVCFGFATLAMQMVLFRIMFYLYLPLPTLFPVILAAYLGMMALGEFITGHVCDRLPSAVSLQRMGYVLLLGAMVAFAAVFTIPAAQMITTDFFSNLAHSWIYIFGAMLPVAFLGGYLPLLIKIITRDLGDVGINFGFVLGISTLGNVLGVFITTILLFEYIGTWGSVLVVFLVVFFGCVLINEDTYTWVVKIRESAKGKAKLSLLSQCRKEQPWVISVMTIFLIVAAALPYKFYSQPWEEFKPYGFTEGKTGVVTAVPYPKRENEFIWLFNSRTMCARANLIEPISLSTWALTRLMAFDSTFRPRKALQIGLGEGIFHYAMKELPFLECMDVVEISPEVINTWKHYTKPKTLAVSFDHPKVHLSIMDGRRFIRHAIAQGEKYDLIQIGVLNPAVSGASNLYSKEMFDLAKQALKPGGYLILISFVGPARTALQSFNTVFWLGDSGKGWVYATDKSFEHLPSHIECPIDPWLGKIYRADTIKAMDLSDLENLQMQRPVAYHPFQAEIFDKKWLEENYEVNTDDRLIYEYNLLSSRKKGYINQVKPFGTINYKARVIDVSVKDSMQLPVIPKSYEDFLGHGARIE